MVRKSASRKITFTAPPKPGWKQSYAALLKTIESANKQMEMAGRAAAIVNQTLVIRNWIIGAYIVEYEQGRAHRAKYGARLQERLAGGPAARRIQGLELRKFRNCRVLCLRHPQIRQPAVAEFGRTLSLPGIRQTVSDESARPIPARGSSTRKSPFPRSAEPLLQRSWSKLVEHQNHTIWVRPLPDLMAKYADVFLNSPVGQNAIPDAGS